MPPGIDARLRGTDVMTDPIFARCGVRELLRTSCQDQSFGHSRQPDADGKKLLQVCMSVDNAD